MKRVLVVIGPSGVGKSTLVSELRREGLIEILPSWTTRKRRHYEQDDELDHVFCSEAEFIQRRDAGYFIETVRLFGLDVWYGLPHLELNETSRIPTLLLRAPLLERLTRHVRGGYYIYQIEAPFERVCMHLSVRDQRDGAQGSRLQDFFAERELGRRLAQRVITNGSSRAVAVEQFKKFLRTDFDPVSQPDLNGGADAPPLPIEPRGA